MARTNTLIRTLITGDAPATIVSDDGAAEPIVVLSENFWAGRDDWEVAGLDLEIPKLLIDVLQIPSDGVFDEVLAEWKSDRNSWLAIQSFLSEMQVWGTDLPHSVVRTVSSHISREGLRLVTTAGEKLKKHLMLGKYAQRATASSRATTVTKRVSVHSGDAFAIGAGYVELRDHSGRLRATASNRLLDMETAVVAPMVVVPSHFSRLDPQGRCPMCKGKPRCYHDS